MASHGGGALKGWGNGERAWEVRWGVVKPFPRSVGAEGGRKRGLRVELVGAAAMVGGGACSGQGSGRRA